MTDPRTVSEPGAARDPETGPDSGDGSRCRADASVVVSNPNGLHLRPATTFAKAAAASGCTVTVTTAHGEANGHSVLELAMLAATEGTRLDVRVTGEGCQEVVEALVLLVNGGFEA